MKPTPFLKKKKKCIFQYSIKQVNNSKKYLYSSMLSLHILESISSDFHFIDWHSTPKEFEVSLCRTTVSQKGARKDASIWALV